MCRWSYCCDNIVRLTSSHDIAMLRFAISSHVSSQRCMKLIEDQMWLECDLGASSIRCASVWKQGHEVGRQGYRTVFIPVPG